jgi:thioesterase domain-containing protein
VPRPGADAFGGDDGDNDPALLAELFHLEPADLAAAPLPSIDAAIDAARRAGRIGEGFGAPEAERLLRVFKANVAAVHAYAPRPYPGRVTLLRCAATLAGAPSEPTLGWEALAAGGVDLHWMPGDHGTLVFEPHAAAVAECLHTRLAVAGRLLAATGRNS